MKSALSLVAIAALSSTAAAQTVVEPVRYQYGQYNEVFYGGRNPSFTSNAYIYLPPALQAAYAAQRLNTPPNANPYMPYGPGGAVVSPYSPQSTETHPNYVPFVFTDYLPFEEAGQFGYTADDARNEAYANAARIVHGVVRLPAAGNADASTAAMAPVAPLQPAPPSDPKIKAIPLLNWAKAERTRNPVLYKALLDEARKYDPAATDSVERGVASEK